LLARQDQLAATIGNYGSGGIQQYQAKWTRSPAYQHQQHQLPTTQSTFSSYQPTITTQQQTTWIITTQQPLQQAPGADGQERSMSHRGWRNAGLQLSIPPEINNHVHCPSSPKSSVSPRGQFRNFGIDGRVSVGYGVGGELLGPGQPQQQQHQGGQPMQDQFVSQSMPNSFGQYMAVKALKKDAAGDIMTFTGGADAITPMFEQAMSRGECPLPGLDQPCIG
jgi:hypothetical protein